MIFLRMSTTVTFLLRDKPLPFQQACFRCILQFQLISLLNRKPILWYLCYFVLIICSHFILLIKYRSMVSERFSPCHLNACPQWGWSTKSWVLSLFLLRKESLARPSDLPWKEKINMMDHEILSNCWLRKPLLDCWEGGVNQ